MANGERRALPHVFLPGHGDRESFTSPHSGGGPSTLPPRDRAAHAERLSQALTEAIAAADVQMRTRDGLIATGTEGFYLEFDVPTSQRELLDSLENRQGKEAIELLAVRPSDTDPIGHLFATVFVPKSRQDFYQKKVDAYRDRLTKTGKPKNEPLVASIDTIRLAQVRSLFTDDPATFPAAGQLAWWEIWLRTDARPMLLHAAARIDISVREHFVRFAERDVVLALATAEAVGGLISNTNAVAELRLNRDTPATFMEMAPKGQLEWSEDLLARLTPPGPNSPAVCILDSGVTRLHPLIQPALDIADHQAWNAAWTADDTAPQWFGHGTQMSGLALYGDLTPVLSSADPLALTHRLESVKILPDHGQNDPELYGHITTAAVSRAEIQSPERPRVFCLAVTADGDHWRGRPSSWSAKVDDLAYGDGADQRLIVISAGNVRGFYPAGEYLQQNDTACIESPAQAWNALTVGAITDRCTIADPTLAGWSAMAPVGDLSPSSRTSMTFVDEWPIKPDVVFEGGNHGVAPATGVGDHVDELAMLTTFHRPNVQILTVTGDTSAATAQVSRMCAQMLSEHPEMWPETVRALIVHSAEWTPAMAAHLPNNATQIQKRLLVRRYGYGVPHLERALRSVENDVALVVEGELQPFHADDGSVKTRDMVLHDFPWPIEELAGLGDALVQMRVTLSYFVEPNPGERGWTQRHKYCSHGLRFVVKRAEERIEAFRQRINKAARDEEHGRAGGGSETGWFLGPRLRDKGSIHSDTWQGTAADLANRHAIAVYPTGGWWREKPALNRADRRVRYTLVVGLRAPVNVDLYTPIQTLITPQVTIEV